MSVLPGSEFEKRINEKIASGLYTSANQVIRDGLRLLFEKDESDLHRHSIATGGF